MTKSDFHYVMLCRRSTGKKCEEPSEVLRMRRMDKKRRLGDWVRKLNGRCMQRLSRKVTHRRRYVSGKAAIAIHWVTHNWMSNRRKVYAQLMSAPGFKSE